MTRAVIIAVGSELIAGSTVDTNSAYLARRLRQIGIDALRHDCVGDDEDEIVLALRRAVGDAPLVLMTGGLGPTLDDRTREALARFTGTPLREDAEALSVIAAWYRGRGREPDGRARRQALVPEGGFAFPNPVGSAPALRVEAGGAAVYSLPGVPAEMRAFAEGDVLADIARRFPAHVAIRSRALVCFGLPESKADALLAPMFPGASPELAFSVSRGVVTATLTARAPAAEEADALLAEAVRRARLALGQDCFTDRGEALPEVVLQALTARAFTVGFAESCTAGLAAHTLATVPGASEVLVGAVVAYANAAKQAHLGVDAEVLAAHGAVSEPVARAMARGAVRALGVDVAAGITGIAGPSGGSADKPVGTVHVAVAGREGAGISERHRRWIFPGPREAIQRRAALAALDMIRRALAPSA
jgi:nicotinamide-nucleotide amidase